MPRRGGVAALVALVLAVAAAPAHAGTYDVVSCAAPGASGVNRAWTVAPDFDDRFWNVSTGCPLSAFSEPRAGVVAPSWTGGGVQLEAPAGAAFERMVIWRHGYEFANVPEGSPWVVQGYNADATVIGGPLGGETCGLFSGGVCGFGDQTSMSAASRADRPLNTPRIMYSAACFRDAGCPTANDQGFPFAGFSISGSVVTVRENNPPAVAPGGALLAGGWRVADDPLELGATDPVGIRRLRVLVDGAEARAIDLPCDATRVAPCPTSVRPQVALGLADGAHTVTMEATDSAGNVARADRQVLMDRNAPALAFAPSRGGRTIVVDAADPGAGLASGAIAVERGGTFRPLPTRVAAGRLVARLRRGSRRGRTFSATATDNLGRTSAIVGAPVRLRAGFGARLRRATGGSLTRPRTVRGRLVRHGGRPLAGQPVTVVQTVSMDGAQPQVVAVAQTGADGRFSATVPPGPSRSLRVTSPGTGGLQAGLRKLFLRVRWRSTLRLSPRAVSAGGRVRISGRLRLAGAQLPPSGKPVELQAFDRGRWRLFASTRARGPQGRWATSYRFGAGRGTYRMRARIRRDGRLPFVLGYSPVRTVRVG